MRCCESLGGVFGFMLENVRLQRKRVEQEQVAQELRLQTSRSELKALRAQINPHFLFNALNAIASLIHTDPVRADAAVEQLAEVFRYTLRRSDQEWAPLDQELAFARAYLDVEQARFGRRLDVHDRLRSRRWRRAGAVDAAADAGRERGQARHRRRRARPAASTSAAFRANGGLTLEVRDTGPGPGRAAAARGRAAKASACAACASGCSGHFGDRASPRSAARAGHDRRAGSAAGRRADLPLCRSAAR